MSWKPNTSVRKPNLQFPLKPYHKISFDGRMMTSSDEGWRYYRSYQISRHFSSKDLTSSNLCVIIVLRMYNRDTVQIAKVLNYPMEDRIVWYNSVSIGGDVSSTNLNTVRVSTLSKGQDGRDLSQSKILSTAQRRIASEGRYRLMKRVQVSLADLVENNGKRRMFSRRLLNRAVQFRISSDDLTILEEIKEKTKASTISEVVRDALWLYHMLLTCIWQGKRIIIEDQAPGEGGELCEDVDAAPDSIIFPS